MAEVGERPVATGLVSSLKTVAELEGWRTNRTEIGLQYHGEDRNDNDESRRASDASRIASAVRAISTRTCGQSGIHSSSTSVWHSESVMAGNLSVP